MNQPFAGECVVYGRLECGLGFAGGEQSWIKLKAGD